MKKYFRIHLLLLVGLFMAGCHKEVQNVSNTSMNTCIPSKTGNVEAINNDCEEEELFEDVGFNKDKKFKTSKYFSLLYQSEDKNYFIEDKVFTNSKHKGESDIHYPYFKGEEDKYDVLNSIILVSVFDACGYNSHDAVIERNMNYEIKMATDSYVSILFTGYKNNHESSRINNISFAINFDLKNNARVSIDDVIGADTRTEQGDKKLLEQIHYGIKEQLDKEVAEVFESYTTEEIWKQFYQNDKGYYVSEGKIYIQFMISTGSGYSDFVSFNIEK